MRGTGKAGRGDEVANGDWYRKNVLAGLTPMDGCSVMSSVRLWGKCQHTPFLMP